MTLVAVPAWKVQVDNTALSSGSTRRATSVCSASTICAPTTTGSMARCGRAAWPPRPVMRMVKSSVLAQTAPGTAIIWPTGRVGSLCAPNTMSHGKRSNSPSCTITSPPPPFSSAGWKMKCTAPSKLRVSARYRAAPSSMVVCPSWPQPCITPGVCERWGKSLPSGIGSASMSARMPMARALSPCRSVPTTPVPAMLRVTEMPHSASLAATRSLVRRSWKASSGWAWMSRRHAVMSAVNSAMRLWTGKGRDSWAASEKAG